MVVSPGNQSLVNRGRWLSHLEISLSSTGVGGCVTWKSVFPTVLGNMLGVHAVLMCFLHLPFFNPLLLRLLGTVIVTISAKI